MRQSDNSEAIVRNMVPADHMLLVELWAAAWREAMPTIDFEGRRGWIATFLTDPKHRTWVATKADELLGFVSLEKTYLHQLVVAPAAQGTGVATQLLDMVKARAPGGMTLDVNQANGRAVRFYIREGFVMVGAGTNPTSGLATWRLRWRP